MNNFKKAFCSTFFNQNYQIIIKIHFEETFSNKMNTPFYMNSTPSNFWEPEEEKSQPSNI